MNNSVTFCEKINWCEDSWGLGYMSPVGSTVVAQIHLIGDRYWIEDFKDEPALRFDRVASKFVLDDTVRVPYSSLTEAVEAYNVKTTDDSR